MLIALSAAVAWAAVAAADAHARLDHASPAARGAARRPPREVTLWFAEKSGTRLQQRHRDECRGQSGGRRQDRGRSAQCLGVARRAAAAGSGRIRGALAQALCRQASDAGSVQLHRGVRLSVIRGLETAGSGHEDPFPRTRPNRQRRRIAPIRLGYPNRRTTIRH